MKRQPSGMAGFTLVVIGQIVSLLGSSMTAFAVSIWAFEATGKATSLSMLAVAGFAPVVLFSPVAGALVDRWNRKLVMMISDLAAGLTTVVIFILLQAGMLEIWHLYITNFISGIFQAFQWPAYSAAVTMMIPKEQYGRANGMMSLAGPASNIFAPILAAALIGPIGIGGIMIVDIVTFTAAIGALLVVYIPQPKASEAGKEAKSSLVSESLFGFKYIFKRPSLLGLQLMFFYINLTATIGFTLMTPMILSSSGNDEVALGTVMSFGSIGGLVGGLVMSAWGGPKRRVDGVLMGMAATSIFAQMYMGLGVSIGGVFNSMLGIASGATIVWAGANFMGGFIIPILNGSNQAIWQSKVAPDVQGRVFAVRRWIAQITAPFGMLIAGPLADWLMEPAMASDGLINWAFGWIVGTGPGTGMAVIFVVTGLLGMAGGLAGYFFKAVRNAEDILPDYDSVVPEQLSDTQPSRVGQTQPRTAEAVA